MDWEKFFTGLITLICGGGLVKIIDIWFRWNQKSRKAIAQDRQDDQIFIRDQYRKLVDDAIKTQGELKVKVTMLEQLTDRLKNELVLAKAQIIQFKGRPKGRSAHVITEELATETPDPGPGVQDPDS